MSGMARGRAFSASAIPPQGYRNTGCARVSIGETGSGAVSTRGVRQRDR
jgi:hypothetical protein